MAQQSTVTVRLREMILRGDVLPGERMKEAELATRLGVSRTPVRQALPALAQEGLLVPAGKRGYSVRAFTMQHSLDALKLRSVLEGVAARTVAERGVSSTFLARLKACLAEGDVLFTGHRLRDDDELRYGQMNERFHDLIVEEAGIPLLSTLIDRCNVVPFTAPLSVAFSSTSKEKMFDLLFYAHRQHHAIVGAIEARHGDRAEFLFREHAHTQLESQTMSLAEGLPPGSGRAG
ncbi:GntR family transcriptional regulator [Pusillimonas noertemannii]|uniref:GntR family transcriptional regulator n=1 Tax=Pusillimonas noertemannii TaxID=305977 RepID=A0A2U1CI46_9BURK|nr:GntR family transcriptional regulator [Pusillimonas noertemannii]PVY60628.1 GntR family transcriptional regulator [Pusillimonas noertemannii]